jgi:hypothetical protein
MKLESKLRVSLAKRTGNVVLREELADMGSAAHLSKGIKQLLNLGELVRLGAGLYAKAHPDIEGKPRLPAKPDVLAREAFNKLGVHVISVKLQKTADRSFLVIDTGEHRITRKMNVGGIPVQYVHHKTSKLSQHALPNDLDALPTCDVQRYVERFAQNHGVTYARTALDDYAEAITRAAGDDVKLDSTGKLLVALRKMGLISGSQLGTLMINHIREVKRVRSIRRLRKRGVSAKQNEAEGSR